MSGSGTPGQMAAAAACTTDCLVRAWLEDEAVLLGEHVPTFARARLTTMAALKGLSKEELSSFIQDSGLKKAEGKRLTRELRRLRQLPTKLAELGGLPCGTTYAQAKHFVEFTRATAARTAAAQAAAAEEEAAREAQERERIAFIPCRCVRVFVRARLCLALWWG